MYIIEVQKYFLKNAEHTEDIRIKFKSPLSPKIWAGMKKWQGKSSVTMWQIKLHKSVKPDCGFRKAQLFVVKRKAAMLPQLF